MTTRISMQEIKSHLAEYLERAAQGQERIQVERQGKPVAALVSLDDLRRLEAWESGNADTAPAPQARFRRALDAAGVVVQWPSGQAPPDERTPLRIAGPPVSEQIIADRR